MEFFDDISLKDFQDMHMLLGWKYLDNDVVQKSLDNSMFKVTVKEDNKCVGIARIIGDNATHGLLCDVMVSPKYQGQGIGTKMIKYLNSKVQDFVNDGRDEFLVELLPTTGREPFYVKCGYKHKPENMAGVYKWFKNNNLYTDDSKKHLLRLNDGPFASMEAGTKTIEMRLLDEKRKSIKPGDIIIFINRTNEDKRLKAKVIALHPFDSFKSLYKAFDKVKLGYKEDEIAKPEDMEMYYPKEEIESFGVVGIEIKLM